MSRTATRSAPAKEKIEEPAFELAPLTPQQRRDLAILDGAHPRMWAPFTPEPIPGLAVVGVSGKAGSGKDWLADVLVAWGYRKWRFAQHLKMDALKAGFTDEEINRTKPEHVRRWLQEEGTERGRDVYGADCWLRVAHGWLSLLRREFGVQRVVLPDVRFPNEAAFIKALGGTLIRLEHGNRRYPLAGTPAAEHSSETALDGYTGFDLVIENNTDFTHNDAVRLLSRHGLL